MAGLKGLAQHGGVVPVSLLVVQLLFGLFPVAAKRVLDPLGPLGPWSLLGLRVGGAALCLALVHRALSKGPFPVRALGPRLLGFAFLGVVLNMGMFMVGLQRTTATEAVLVITSIPVFTYALAVALGRETIGPYRVAGIVLAVAGVVALVGFHVENLVGNLLVLGNSLSYAAFLVLARPTLQRHGALGLTAWMFAIGALVFVPLGFAHGMAQAAPRLGLEGWSWVAFIILGPTVLTYVLNALMLRRAPASTVAAFTYIQPVFTAVAAHFLLDEPLPASVFAAAALIFTGVWLVARREPAVLQGAVTAE